MNEETVQETWHEDLAQKRDLRFWAKRLARANFTEGVGIAIGSQEMACAHIRKQFAQLSLLRLQSFPLPPGRNTLDLQEAICAGLQTFLSPTLRLPEWVAISLPRQDVLIRRLLLPITAQANLSQVIQYELERLIPFRPEEVVYDFLVHQLGGEEQKIEVLLFCLSRELLNFHLEALTRVGLIPHKLTLNFLGVFNCMLLGQAAGSPMALVTSTREGIEINIASHERLLASQVTSSANGRSGQDVVSLLEQVVSRDCPTLPLDTIQVWRWGSNDGSVGVDELGRTTDLFAWAAEFWQRGAVNGFSSLGANSMLPFSLAAVGAALDAVGEGVLSVNFVPQERRAKRQRVFTLLTLVLGGLLLALTLVWAWALVRQPQKMIKRFNNQISMLQEHVQRVEEHEARIKVLQDRLTELTKDGVPRLAPLLKELAELLPPQVYLLSLDYHNGNVEMQGITQASATELVALLENSPLLKGVALGPTSKLDQGVIQGEIFSLKAQVEE